MTGNAYDLLQEPQTFFLPPGRIAGAEVDEQDVTPISQLAEFADLEIAERARQEIFTEYPCKSLHQTGIWRRKTNTNLLIKQWRSSFGCTLTVRRNAHVIPKRH